MDNPNISSLSGLDQWLNRTWTSAPEEYQWLLLQTLATAPSRRAWIETWPAVVDGVILDLGCGPGIISQEIAALKTCRVVGYDKDPNVLDLAQNINRLFDNQGQVKFRLGDIVEEAGSDREADAACLRFVAQYASDLEDFLRHVANHVAPGGYIAIEDIDDGYLIEHPEPPASWQRAVAAFQRFQSGPAGDRNVGRKLAEAGISNGLALKSLSLNPFVHAGPLNYDDLSVQFDVDRIDRAVPDMIGQGLLSHEEWYEARAQYRASFPHFTYVSTATVRLLFQVP